MILHLVTRGFVLSSILSLGMSEEGMVGRGRWSILDVQPCASDAEMPWTLRARRYAVNSTHDAFDADFNTLAVFDDSVGIRINTCMMEDGECKNFQSLEYECARILIYFAAKHNLRRALENMGVDPPEFPLPEGEYHLKNFVLDIRHLHNHSLYGTFSSEVILWTADGDVACLAVTANFRPVDDEES